MKAHLNREKDKELYKLSQYLREIAKLDDFSGLNHKHWERWVQTTVCSSHYCFAIHSVLYFCCQILGPNDVRIRSHATVCNLLSVQVPVKETAPLREDHPGHPGCTRHHNCHMQTVSFKLFISNGATDPRLDPPATKHFKAQDWVGLPTMSVSVSNLSSSSLFFFCFVFLLYFFGIICI